MDVIPMVAKEIVSRLQKQAAFPNSNTTDPPTLNGTGHSPVICTVGLAEVLLRIWLLGSPHTDAMGNVGQSVEAIEALVDELVGFLLSSSAPSLACLRLQSARDALKGELLGQRRTEMVKKEALMLYFTKRVLRYGPSCASDEVLGDILLLILHRYDRVRGVDEATGLAHRRDTLAALSLVLPRRKVPGFIRLDAVERRRQLEEIARVVWGIRLFNREEGREEGVGLPDPREGLEGPLDTLKRTSEDGLARLRARMTPLLAVMERPTSVLPGEEQRRLREEYHHLQQIRHIFLAVRGLQRGLSVAVKNEVFARFVTALRELRKRFAAKSGRDKANGEVRISEGTTGGITSASDTLVGVGSGPPSVLKEVVYPMFMALADASTAARRLSLELEEAGRLLELALHSEDESPSTLPEELAEEAMPHIAREKPSRGFDIIRAEVEGVLNDETSPTSRALKEAGLQMKYLTSLPDEFDAITRECYPESLCALRGFCPVRFAQTGLLREARVPRYPASSSLSNANDINENGDTDADDKVGAGLLVVEGRFGGLALARPQYFAFRDEPALLAFVADPLRYLRAAFRGEYEIVDLPNVPKSTPNAQEKSFSLGSSGASREPAAMLLAGLLDYAPRELYIAGARMIEAGSSALSSRAEGTMDETKSKCVDAGTQTGQIDPYFDHNYYWNEWDLRRQALKLVNLLNMRTHFTQTTASRFRRENATQASPPKTSATQTMIDAATQPLQTVQYLKGLRGTASSEVKQVQRTFQY
ncbi:unnamed protein product [Phytomonas sp. Hart1]|nr:unnamed protein product [Phytomonas sp. Hart1]|eukprot:CCW69692.1 unnamed protein product [Phytomonas sp. isolate Hart1]